MGNLCARREKFWMEIDYKHTPNYVCVILYIRNYKHGECFGLIATDVYHKSFAVKMATFEVILTQEASLSFNNKFISVN
jgi:hypothetical protein